MMKTGGTGEVCSSTRLSARVVVLYVALRYNRIFLSPPEGGLDLVTNRKGAIFLQLISSKIRARLKYT